MFEIEALLKIFRSSRQEMLAPYVSQASTAICEWLESLKPGVMSEYEQGYGFKIFAHHRLFIPKDIARRIDIILWKRSNDDNAAFQAAFLMRRYAKKYGL